MKIEHIAFNVSKPLEMAQWYTKHLGMRVVRKVEGPPYIHFLADDSGSMLIEIYSNPAAGIPEYAAMNPLMLHLAFVSDDPAAQKTALLAHGATFVEDVTFDDGSFLVMMRDPWGLPIQFCKRTRPMLRS